MRTGQRNFAVGIIVLPITDWAFAGFKTPHPPIPDWRHGGASSLLQAREADIVGLSGIPFRQGGAARPIFPAGGFEHRRTDASHP